MRRAKKQSSPLNGGLRGLEWRAVAGGVALFVSDVERATGGALAVDHLATGAGLHATAEAEAALAGLSAETLGIVHAHGNHLRSKGRLTNDRSVDPGICRGWG